MTQIKQPHHEKWPFSKRITSVVSACFEHTLFCGLIFGWASIQYVYQYTCYYLPQTITGLPVSDSDGEKGFFSSIFGGHSDTSAASTQLADSMCKKLGTSTDTIYQVTSCSNVHTEMANTTNNWTLADAEKYQLSFLDLSDNSTVDPFSQAELYNNIDECARGYQQKQLSVIMKRAVQAFICTAFFWGTLWDKIGTRYYRITMNSILIVALLVLGFAEKEPNSTWLLYIGLPLLHIGGMTTYSTNLRCPSLFPKKSGILIQLVNGAFEASACTLLIAKFFFFEIGGLSATTFWKVWAGLAVPIVLLRTAFVMPKLQYRDKVEGMTDIDAVTEAVERIELKDNEQDTNRIENHQKLEKANISIDKSNELNPDRTFLECIISKQFFCQAWWLLVMDSWNITFFVSYLSWATWLTENNKDDTSFWVNIWAIFQFAGAPLAIAVGFIYDNRKRAIEKSVGCEQVATLRALGIVVAITTSMGVLATLLSSFKSQGLQWVTFTLQLTFRACLYGNNAQAIQTLYPGKYFGQIYGFVFIPTFIGAESTSHLITLATEKNISFTILYKVFTGVVMTAFIFPAFLFWRSKNL